jgi:hypothetical protein
MGLNANEVNDHIDYLRTYIMQQIGRYGYLHHWSTYAAGRGREMMPMDDRRDLRLRYIDWMIQCYRELIVERDAKGRSAKK